MKRIPKRVKRKAQEYLTVMFIPHDGKPSFSLHLNWTIIIFVIGLIFSILFLAGLAIYQNYIYSYEKNELFSRYGNKLKSTIILERIAQKNKQIYNTITEHITKLTSIIHISETEMEQLQSRLETTLANDEFLNDKIKKEQKSAGIRLSYLPAVYSFRSLHLFTKNHIPLFKKIYDSYTKKLELYTKIPIGRPFYTFEGLHDTSGFGWRLNPISHSGSEFHGGFDTAGPVGTPIYATAPGTVHKNYYNSNGYGRTIVLKHEFGLYSIYAHLSKSFIRSGEKVKKGQKIGLMGNSGRVTGSHLHYEIHREDKKKLDPKPFICALDFHTNSCLRYHALQKN